MANAPFNITCSEGGVGGGGWGDTGIGEMERKKGDKCFKRVGKERNRGKLPNNAYNRKTAKGRKPRKRGAGAESARYGKREIWTP